MRENVLAFEPTWDPAVTGPGALPQATVSSGLRPKNRPPAEPCQRKRVGFQPTRDPGGHRSWGVAPGYGEFGLRPKNRRRRTMRENVPLSADWDAGRSPSARLLQATNPNVPGTCCLLAIRGGRLSGGQAVFAWNRPLATARLMGEPCRRNRTCAWHLLSVRSCWPKANFTVAWGNAPGGLVPTRPKLTASHPNTFRRLAEGQPQPSVALRKGPLCRQLR
jgi:hypothetical protein